jgi:signal transduction histidine kinase
VPLIWDLGLLGLGVLAVGVAVLAWRNRPRAGATWLAAAMACVAVRSLSHLGNHHLAGRLGDLAARLQFAALAPVPFLVFAFVLAYTGRRRYLARRALPVLFAWPVALVALVWLPADVGGPLAVWPGIEAETGGPFWANLAISYGLLAVATGLLLEHLRTAVGLFQSQTIAVLAGLSFAWAGSLVSAFQLFGSAHAHALQVGLAGMGLCFLWGVVGTGLTRVSPIARRTVVRTLDAGVLAVDADHRVTIANPAAGHLLDLPEPAAVVGEPLAEALSAHPDLADWLRGFESPTDGGSARFTLDDRVVTCEVSPLTDDRDRFVGAATVLWDVTGEERRREELERQNERLDQFASRLTHDLKSPLTVATGNLELAREDDVDSEEVLDTAAEALEHMETLIEDLRALAEAGQSIETVERVALAEAAQRAWRIVAAADATLTVHDDGVLRADPERLGQLLDNLFRNAVEHGSTSPASDARQDAVEHGSTSPASDARQDAVEHGSTSPASDAPEGAVSIHVGTTPDGFYVADDGPGIPPEDRQAVFDEGFSTGDGMGVGLTIVADVVEAHGWDITVTESMAGGARFEITGVERPDDAAG